MYSLLMAMTNVVLCFLNALKVETFIAINYKGNESSNVKLSPHEDTVLQNHMESNR